MLSQMVVHVSYLMVVKLEQNKINHHRQFKAVQHLRIDCTVQLYRILLKGPLDKVSAHY